MSAKGKKGLTVRWSRVKGAEGYDVFFAKCNTSRKIHTFKKVKTLKVGRTSKIRAKVKKLRKNRKLISKKHAPRLRYLSTDQKIAVVTRDGRITAKGRGTCRIYVYAANGVYKTVRVTVK